MLVFGNALLDNVMFFGKGVFQNLGERVPNWQIANNCKSATFEFWMRGCIGTQSPTQLVSIANNSKSAIFEFWMNEVE